MSNMKWSTPEDKSWAGALPLKQNLYEPELKEGAFVGEGRKPINATLNEAVITTAAEGRRLYIGNLAYATTEGELKDFFKDYLVETSALAAPPLATSSTHHLASPAIAEARRVDTNLDLDAASAEADFLRYWSPGSADRPRAPISTTDTSTARQSEGQKRSTGLDQSNTSTPRVSPMRPSPDEVSTSPESQNIATFDSRESRPRSPHGVSSPSQYSPAPSFLSVPTERLRRSSADHEADIETASAGKDLWGEHIPFAFAPGHMTKLLNPKSLDAFHALDALACPEQNLQIDGDSGWRPSTANPGEHHQPENTWSVHGYHTTPENKSRTGALPLEQGLPCQELESGSRAAGHVTQDVVPTLVDAGIDKEGQLAAIREDYDRRWLLNLTMNFHDKSGREKLFVTYAETDSKWRRLTISVDYRNAPQGSLEVSLKTMHSQHDKSFRIFEALRDSLDDIQYYDTVTCLTLETTAEDGQLHVHVREDADELVHLPGASRMRDLPPKRNVERDALSGRFRNSAKVFRNATGAFRNTANALTEAHPSDKLDGTAQFEIHEPRIDIILGRVPVSAFPDTGAEANYGSLAWARSAGAKIDTSMSKLVTLANGARVKSIGTVQKPIAFPDSSKQYVQTIHILRTCIHNIVLGRSFLDMTKTLTQFKHRVKRVLRGFVAPRVCLLGTSRKYLGGYLGKTRVVALSDTGSDLSLVSEDYVSYHSCDVDRSSHGRMQVRLADGSTVFTTGVLKNMQWSFDGEGSAPLGVDMYVLPNLACDVLVGYHFLYRTNAFGDHHNDFEDYDDRWEGHDACFESTTDEALWNDTEYISFNAVKVVFNDDPPLAKLWQDVRTETNQAFAANWSRSQSLPPHEAQQIQRLDMARRQRNKNALDAYVAAKKQAALMPTGSERDAYTKVHRDKIKDYLSLALRE